MAAKTRQDDGRNQVEEFNSQWRDGEQALLRLNRNTAERGDGIRLARVGLADPGRQRTESERISAVAIQLGKAGTAKEFQQTRNDFEETEPRCRAALEHCGAELERLDELRAAVIRERAELETELANATNALRVMEAARERLRSPALLPSHIVAELNSRRVAVNHETGERRRELTELIPTLNADAGRLAGQTDGHGNLQNEGLLEQYATRAAANESHRGHEFWVDRVYSLLEWRNFEAWARTRAGEHQAELDQLKSAAAAKLADEVEELSGFYTHDIE